MAAQDLLSNTGEDSPEGSAIFSDAPCSGDDIQRLRAIFDEKKWIGFDLDDTLHDFRRSSRVATDRVLEKISGRYGTPVSALHDQYSVILKTKTANSFSDGKTSFDYRRERFSSLLSHFSLPQDEHFISELLDIYEASLTASLELKSGAVDLLTLLKELGKKIVVITEGPQDAQERTVRALGIDGLIDCLATTNRFGVSKTDALFPRVLEHLEITAGDMVYIGDSGERDMRPALAEGIFSIHLAETEDGSLDTIPPRIQTLRKLHNFLSSDGCPSSSQPLK